MGEAREHGPHFQTLCSGLRFPEGPIALDDGSVLVVEIEGQTLTQVFQDGRVERLATLGGGPNGAQRGPDGAIYICNNGGLSFVYPEGQIRTSPMIPPGYVSGSIQRIDLETGDVTVLYTDCDGLPLRGPNDLVFDARGGFYFTDPGKVTATTMDRGSVFYAQPDGSRIDRVVSNVVTPNGIGILPDDETLVFAETLTGRVLACSIDRDAPERLGPLRLFGRHPDLARLDSLAIDADGNACVGTIDSPAGGIATIGANGHFEFLPLPDEFTTNICFGGPDLTTAYATLSTTGRLLRLEWPVAGHPLAF